MLFGKFWMEHPFLNSRSDKEACEECQQTYARNRANVWESLQRSLNPGTQSA